MSPSRGRPQAKLALVLMGLGGGGGAGSCAATGGASPHFFNRLLMTEQKRGKGRNCGPCLPMGLSVALLMGCNPDAEMVVPAGMNLQSVRSVELAENPEDPIGDIQDLILTSSGSILIADRYQPRVRAFAEDGSLAHAFGQFGDGPFEFRSINSIALDSQGRLLVLDGTMGRITRLTGQLEPDTLISASPRP